MPYANPNDPKRKAYEKEYHRLNRKELTRKAQIWRLAHPEHMREERKRWSRRPNGILICLRGRAKRRKVPFELEKISFLEWFNNQEQECFYCGLTKDKQGERYKNLSIDRKDNLISYRLDNIVLCCMRCNTIKGNFFTAEEMIEIANKYIRPKQGIG